MDENSHPQKQGGNENRDQNVAEPRVPQMDEPCIPRKFRTQVLFEDGFTAIVECAHCGVTQQQYTYDRSRLEDVFDELIKNFRHEPRMRGRELDELRGRLADADGAIRELSRMNADMNAKLCEYRARVKAGGTFGYGSEGWYTAEEILAILDELFPEAKEGGEG